MDNSYIFSYTAATLMLHETHEVIKKYLEFRDWGKTKDFVIEENIMQKQSVSSRKRVFIEIKRRVESLTSEQLEYFKDASSSDIRNLIFLAILKTYRFIFEFIVEVVLKKFLMFDYRILNSDYESFFESKKYAIEQLENITQNTEYKLKQVLFRILEESMFIDSTKNKNILKPILSNEVIELIAVGGDPPGVDGTVYPLLVRNIWLYIPAFITGLGYDTWVTSVRNSFYVTGGTKKPLWKCVADEIWALVSQNRIIYDASVDGVEWEYNKYYTFENSTLKLRPRKIYFDDTTDTTKLELIQG